MAKGLVVRVPLPLRRAKFSEHEATWKLDIKSFVSSNQECWANQCYMHSKSRLGGWLR